MRQACGVVILGVCGSLAVAGERHLTVETARGLPALETVIVYRGKEGKRELVGELKSLDKALPLPDDGPFEVWVKPKNGIAVKVLDKLAVPAGKPPIVKLGDLLGVVEVLGDNFPRAQTIVITPLRDPGPGERGHVAVQVAKDYRESMAVPPGFYEVWVVPFNGAKAQRIEDNIRVLAGRTVRVGD